MIKNWTKFNESEDTRRFVGSDGGFQPTNQPEEGTTTIQYLEELLEWLYYHDNISDEEKMRLITGIEDQIQSLLNGGSGKRFTSVEINYIPTWSTKLKKNREI